MIRGSLFFYFILCGINLGWVYIVIITMVLISGN